MLIYINSFGYNIFALNLCLPPLHALPEPRHLFPRLRLPEHVQMLMPYQIKIILLPEPPLPCAFHLPLELDDILTQYEPRLKEAHEHPRRYGHEMLVPPRVPNQDGAVLPRPEHAHALLRDRAHFRGELSDVMHA